MRAAKNTLMVANVRLFRHKTTQHASATLLLVACVFPECVALLTDSEPKEHAKPTGSPFWTGELFEWDVLARLWRENKEVEEALVVVTKGLTTDQCEVSHSSG